MEPDPSFPPSPTTSRFRAPDGGVVTIAAPGYDFGEHWSAYVRITTNRPYAGTPEGLQQRQLHVTPAGNYDLVLDRVIEGRWVNMVEAQDGYFLIGHSDTADQGLALWRGQWHEAATWLPEPKMPGAQALQYLAALRFDDSPEGLVITPFSRAMHTVEVLDVNKRVPGVGFVDVRRPATAHPLVPTWSGSACPTGEVWLEELNEEPETASEVVVIHATPTTVTTITGEADDSESLGPRLQFLDELSHLSWSDE